MNFSGEIVQRDFPITRESFVRDVTEKLQEMYPGYFIRLKNQLLKLRDEQKIANVMDPEDILTVFIQKGWYPIETQHVWRQAAARSRCGC